MTVDRAEKYREFLLWRLRNRTADEDSRISAAIRRMASSPVQLNGRLKVGDEVKRGQERSAAMQAEFEAWLGSQQADQESGPGQG